jgi:HTH-type transcriptional regulator / antitoxin HigA
MMQNWADYLDRLESVEITAKHANTKLLSYNCGTVVSNIDLEVLAPAWRSFQNRTSVEFCTIKTKRHYRAMVNLLNELVDEIGDRESHALMGLLDIVSHFVHDYEERNVEFPNPEPHEVLRFFMEQHNLRQADLANILGSHANVCDVLNGTREIDTSRARILAARFHVSPAVFIREIRSTN